MEKDVLETVVYVSDFYLINLFFKFWSYVNKPNLTKILRVILGLGGLVWKTHLVVIV